MTATDRAARSQDEARIRELMAEQETAMRAKEAERLVARYAPDIVKFDLAPPLRRGGPEVVDPTGLRKWFDGFDGPVGYDVRDLSVTAGEDVAFCHSLNRLAATPRGTTQGFEMWFRATVCLRKIDGVWKIAHEHTSTPFYMDGSFRAALDLQP